MLETKKKSLTACPTCELAGTKSILGEVNEIGDFVVEGLHQRKTIVKAPTMTVICGKCLTEVYIKK